MRLVVLFLGSTILIGVISMVLIMTAKEPLEDSPFNKQTFDQQIWRHYDMTMDRDSLRGMMAGDVKTMLDAQKPNREKMLILLGKPDVENTPMFFSYHLGMWSHHRAKIDTLDITFDSEGNMTSAMLVQH